MSMSQQLRNFLSPIRRACLDLSLGALPLAKTPLRGRPMIVGFLSAPMGIGTGSALIHSGLAAIGFSPSSFDLTPIFQKERSYLPWPPFGEKPDDGSGPVIVHVNALESAHALEAIANSNLRDRFRVAYWAWELPVVPKSWIPAARRYNEIWVPSEFTAKALRPFLGEKVKVIGYPIFPPLVEVRKILDTKARLLRGDVEGFLVLAAGDLRSSLIRKNIIGAIQSFRMAFPSRGGCGLVLKTSGLKEAPIELKRDIYNAIGADERITLLDAPLNQIEFDTLFAAADVFLSIHRSEGFGLSIARSLLSGTPVVVTNWSGNTDFADLPGTRSVGYKLIPARSDRGEYNLKGAVWADPDHDEAVSQLRALAQSPTVERQTIASAAKERFSPDFWAQRLSADFLAACERN